MEWIYVLSVLVIINFLLNYYLASQMEKYCKSLEKDFNSRLDLLEKKYLEKEHHEPRAFKIRYREYPHE